MSAKSYLGRILLSTTVVVLLVLGINAGIDPYAITGAPRIPLVNEYKVDINNFTRLMKKYHPQEQQQNALVLGNSRVEMGLDPAHACLTAAGLQVYNLGMPGADIRTQLAYALNVIYQQPITTVFFSLDFTDFIDTEIQPLPAEALLQQSSGELKYLPSGELNPDYFEYLWQDFYRSLFSLDAMISSVRTVLLQSNDAPDRDRAGFNPARDFHQAVRVEGPRALFEQKMHNLQEKYSQPWYLRDPGGNLPPQFADIAAFLELARQRGIAVHLFTNPFHESYWELLDSQGFMPVYQDWLSSLTELARSHTGSPVSLWDFSMDSPYIHEVVPAVDARSGPLKWFWEPAHYRRQLGDYMLDAMLSESCGSEVRLGQKLL